VIFYKDIEDAGIYSMPKFSYDLFPFNKNCGFFAIIPKVKCPSGIYKLGIEIQERYFLSVKSYKKSIKTQTSIIINPVTDS
jgi:hypothetical protein